MILKENKKQWFDLSLEFDNKIVRFDKIVRDRLNDKLGLFKKNNKTLIDIRDGIIEYEAKK